MVGVGGGGGGNDSSCYATMIDPAELWTEPPLLGPLPALVRQMTVTIGSNLFFLVIFHPFHQPRIVRDILSALMVSPFILDMINPKASDILWPKSGTTNLECLAKLGLVYAMFIKGLQIDTTPITHGRGAKTLALLSGIVLLPFTFGLAAYLAFSMMMTNNKGKDQQEEGGGGMTLFLYWGAILSSTSFESIVQVLTRLKLLCTETGIEALSLGMVNDLFSWLFVMVAIGLSAMPVDKEDNNLMSFQAWVPFVTVVMFMICFGAFCYLAVRPVIKAAIARTENGERIGDSTIHFLLFTVMACGLISEVFGAYCIVGAFMLGLCIPHSHLASVLVEKMEDCVSGVLMPLFYATIAIKMTPEAFEQGSSGFMLIGISMLTKPLCVFLICLVCDLPIQNSFALGTLLSAKGVVSIVIALVGVEHGHLSKKSFTILIMAILFSTIPVGPTMAFIYKKMLRSTKPYKLRTIQASNKQRNDDDFKVVACIHDSRQIPAVMNLVELANVTHWSPMSVFPLHLVELIGRASNMLISDSSASSFFRSKGTSGQSARLISAFRTYEQYHTGGSTTVQTLTVISAVNSMHEDISTVAEDKQANLIILPFHDYQLNVDDSKLDDTANTVFRQVNQNVMGTSPCSVVLLVDRGLGLLPLTPITGSIDTVSYHGSTIASSTIHSSYTNEVRVAMLYFGGPDDREALSFATRIAANPQVTTLTVIRFLVGDNPVDADSMMFPFADDGDDSIYEENDTCLTPIYTQNEMEKEIDDKFIRQTIGGKKYGGGPSIEYQEKISNNGEETLAHLRGMNHAGYNLYIVGRGREVRSPLTVGLTEWSDNPELGVIGDALLTSDFAEGVSIAVIQTWAGARLPADEGNKCGEESESVDGDDVLMGRKGELAIDV